MNLAEDADIFSDRPDLKYVKEQVYIENAKEFFSEKDYEHIVSLMNLYDGIDFSLLNP